jgi:hypothetical protein
MPRPPRRVRRSERRAPASSAPPPDPAPRDPSTRDVKDRLVQTRVPQSLESVLKAEAKRRRLSVSHLIRNVLEDTLALVDSVVAGGEELVDGSKRLAEQVARDAGRLAKNAKEGVAAAVEPPAAPANARNLDHVLAWIAVTLNREARCARCDRDLPKGSSAQLGISSDPSQPPAWLCDDCLPAL